jgi:transposase
MAKAYSNDLRCKLLTAYDRGQGSLRVLAELFSVSYDWAKKISRQRLRSQQMERVAQSRHGVESRVTPAVEAELLRQLREQPDSTLADLRKGLQHSLGIGISSQHLWRVLKRLGVRLKKVAPRRRARHRSESRAAGGVPRENLFDAAGQADFPG